VRTASGDARRMPPPAVPVKRDSSSSDTQPWSTGASSVYDRNAGRNASTKGKEKAVLGRDEDFSVIGSRTAGTSSSEVQLLV
jgi:hypothetical protein